MTPFERCCAVAIVTTVVGGVVCAQSRGGGAEWPTTSGDAQRTSWIRADAAISVDALSKPGFELQWKTKLDNQPRQMNALNQGVVVNGVTLFTPLSIVTGSSNNIYALDNDTGNTFWRRHIDAPLPSSTTPGCPGGITASATRMTDLVLAPAPAARAGGARNGGYQTLVGEPGEGAPTLQRAGGPARGAAPADAAGRGVVAPGGAPGAAGAAGRAGGAGRGAGAGPVGGGVPGMPAGAPVGGGSGFARPSGVAYVITSDGQMHTVGLPSGKDIQKPAPFVPANAHASDPIAVVDVLYTTTTGKCGGAPDGVWAMDLGDPRKPVVSFKTNGNPIGPVAFTSNGTVIASVGPGQLTSGGGVNGVVALDPKTLRIKDWFTQPGTEIASAPLVFKRNDQELVAVATRDGRILLLDAAALGGANASHATPLYASRSFTGDVAHFLPPEALAMWEGGTPATSWLLMPLAGRLPVDLQVPVMNGAQTGGAILGLKIVDAAGKPALEPSWLSRDIASPPTPLIVNGVVFAVSRGTARTPAVLYALNGANGKEVWSSGATMTSFMPGRSIWSGTGQVYVGTFDGTVYAFGFAMERK